MLTITVAQDGSGDFASVSEAVLAVPYACAAEIRIGPGVYREKLVCEKQDITLIGAGMESTRIVWGDGGSLPHPDGRPTHTCLLYTSQTHPLCHKNSPLSGGALWFCSPRFLHIL